MGEPNNPVVVWAADEELTRPPTLVKVDRYGSVSGLVRVRTPLGVLVIVTPEEASFGS